MFQVILILVIVAALAVLFYKKFGGKQAARSYKRGGQLINALLYAANELMRPDKPLISEAQRSQFRDQLARTFEAKMKQARDHGRPLQNQGVLDDIVVGTFEVTIKDYDVKLTVKDRKALYTELTRRFNEGLRILVNKSSDQPVNLDELFSENEVEADQAAKTKPIQTSQPQTAAPSEDKHAAKTAGTTSEWLLSWILLIAIGLFCVAEGSALMTAHPANAVRFSAGAAVFVLGLALAIVLKVKIYPGFYPPRRQEPVATVPSTETPA